MFGNQYKGPIYKYDLNSAYAAIYSSNNCLIPIKEGEFKTITTAEFEAMKFYYYGIYHVKIEYPDDDSKWKKLFRLNFDNFYTSTDLTWAKSIGLKMQVIAD